MDATEKTLTIRRALDETKGIRPRTAAASIGFHRRDGSHGMQDSVRFNGV
jgi:hypothetical protein